MVVYTLYLDSFIAWAFEREEEPLFQSPKDPQTIPSLKEDTRTYKILTAEQHCGTLTRNAHCLNLKLVSTEDSRPGTYTLRGKKAIDNLLNDLGAKTIGELKGKKLQGIIAAKPYPQYSDMNDHIGVLVTRRE